MTDEAPLPPLYTPGRWFWRIREDGRIYSSADRAFVDRGDPERTTDIATLAELEEVLEKAAPDRLPRDSARFTAFRREQIRLEADRRVQRAIGARNLSHSYEAQLTGTATAAAIINKRIARQPLTPEEQWVEFTYGALFEFIRRVKTAQGVLEASLADDFADDRNWPAP